MLATSVSTTPQTSSRPAATNGTGAFLYADDGRALPLREASVRAEACGGVATVVLQQRFENPYAEPLRVTYLMPLPQDGAVSGYAFVLGERRVVGEVDRKARARERFEEALSEGRTAGIVEQQRANLFTQELGNVPPHASVTAEIRIDQRLAWLVEGMWEWRFPTTAGPRYMGTPGRVVDEVQNTLTVATETLPVAIRLDLFIRDELTAGVPQSASHPLRVTGQADRVDVAFSDEKGVPLDRDIIVRWGVARPKLGLTVDVARPSSGNASLASYGLVSVVPPRHDSPDALALARDVCLLLDVSGSMGGEPLAHVKRVCERIIDALTAKDRLELVAFSSRAMRFGGAAEYASDALKRRARTWINDLRAGGGTEMAAGIIEALAPLNAESQRQVVLLTDGYVGFENEVVRTIADRLPAASRFHVVGVGSAVNRALTRPASRAGRGVELIIAPGEDASRTSERLLVRLNAPIAMEVHLDGDALLHTAPARLPDVYAGSPMIAAVKVRTDGGTLLIRARTAMGTWEQTVAIPALEAGTGPRHIAALYARESVEDLELREASSLENHSAEIEQLGLDFQIATTHTTWVAISDEVTVDPTMPTRRQVMPQQLPHGVSAEGVGLRAATGAMMPTSPPPAGRSRGMAVPLAKVAERIAGQAESQAKAEGFMQRAKAVLDGIGAGEKEKKRTMPAAPASRFDDAPKDFGTAARMILRAVLRLVTPKRVTLAVQSPTSGMQWTLPTTLTIRLAGGRTLQANVETSQSTRAGAVEAGLEMKLVLDVTEDLRSETIQTIACDAWEIHVGA